MPARKKRPAPKPKTGRIVGGGILAVTGIGGFLWAGIADWSPVLRVVFAGAALTGIGLIIYALKDQRRIPVVIANVGLICAGAAGLAAVPFDSDDKPVPPPSPSPSPSQTSSRQPPIKVDLVRIEPNDDSNVWATREPLALTPAQLREWDAAEDDDAWILAKGGVYVGQTETRIVIKGNHVTPVTLVGMRAISTCEEPLNGSYLTNPNQGITEIAKVGFDLDRPNPEAASVVVDELGHPVEDEEGKIEMRGVFLKEAKDVRLEKDEPVTFRVYAQVTRFYCTYVIRIETLSNGEISQTTIDNNGQPFRLTGHAKGADFAGYRDVYFGGLWNKSVGWARGKRTADGRWQPRNPAW